MAYDKQLAERVRQMFADRRDIKEKVMFGGLAFMARGHMCCGLVQEQLMVRVDPQDYDRLLNEPHVRPMDFTGRPMRGLLYIEADGTASTPALRRWIGRALAFVEGLPPQKPRKPRVSNQAAGRSRSEAARRTAKAKSRPLG